MKSMKMTKAQQEKSSPAVAEAPKEEYPYGLRINLDHEALKKLGIDNLPTTGTKIKLEALAHVTDVHQSEHIDGKEPMRSLGIQITDLGLDHDSDEEPASKKLYGKTASKE